MASGMKKIKNNRLSIKNNFCFMAINHPFLFNLLYFLRIYDKTFGSGLFTNCFLSGKIKNKKTFGGIRDMKLKLNWIPFVISFISILGLRVYQILSIGNAAVRINWDNFEIVCFIIAAAAFGIIMIASYLSKDAPDVFVIKKNLLTGSVAILAATLALWSSIEKFRYYWPAVEKDWVDLFYIVTGVLAAVVFVLIGLGYIKEKNYFEKNKLLVLMPTLWVLAMILKLFFVYNSVQTSVIHVSNALAKIFLLFFMFSQARLFASLFNSATFKKLFYFGFSASLFMLISITNFWAVTIDFGRNFSTMEISNIITEFALIAYILCVIFSVQVGKNLGNAEDKPVVEKKESENIEAPAAAVTSTDTVENREEMAKVDRLIEDIKNENANKNSASNEGTTN